MPALPVEDFLASLEALVAVDAPWVPDEAESSLYLRPFAFASEAFLGVRPARGMTYLLIASPVGPYFSGGLRPVPIWVAEDLRRAGPGGTGAAKCSGNYAASLASQVTAYERGCEQVCFLDAATGRGAAGTLATVHVVLLAGSFALLLGINSLRMWWFTTGSNHRIRTPMSAYLKSLYLLPLHFFTQKRYAKCASRRPWVMHLALMSARNIPIFVVVAAPIVAWALSEFLGRIYFGMEQFLIRDIFFGKITLQFFECIHSREGVFLKRIVYFSISPGSCLSTGNAVP